MRRAWQTIAIVVLQERCASSTAQEADVSMLTPRLYLSEDFLPFADLIARYGREATISKGTVLHDANGPQRRAYYIREGVARLSYLNEEGTEGTLFFFGRGSIYPINVRDEVLTAETYLHLVAVTDLSVIRFPGLQIVSMCEESQDFGLAIINHYVGYANVLITKQLLNSYNDSTQLVSALLYLYVNEQSNVNGVVDLTQEQIGQVTGLSRTQVTRVLGVLRSDRVVETHRGRLRIVDLGALKDRYTHMSSLF